MRLLVWAVVGLWAGLWGVGLAGAVAETTAVAKPPALPLSTRGPLRVSFEAHGRRALVTESDTGTVALLNADTGQIIRRIPTGGTQPTGAVFLSGGQILVTNRLSGSIALLNSETGTSIANLSLKGEPTEVIAGNDGKSAYISVAQLDQVVTVSIPELKVTGRIAVGRRPRSMALTPDGRTLLVANLQGGDVSVVDLQTERETRRIPLTGVNLRGVAISPDGARAYVTGQIPANTRATAEPLDIWTNTVFVIHLPPVARTGSEGWIDFSLAPSPDPDAIVALDNEHAAVTIAGSDEVIRIRTPGPHLRTYDPVIVARRTVGARPRGLALSPDRKQLWVANELDGTITVLHPSTLEIMRKIPLGAPAGIDPTLPGRYLFGSAQLTRGGQFTCDSCHPNGGSDGLDWEFVHVPDTLERRNTRNLRGGILNTPPFRWTGHDLQLRDFLHDEVTGLLKGPEPTKAALSDIEQMLGRLEMPPNPFRTEDNHFSKEALRGKSLFEGKAGCINCHAGPQAGGTGISAWIGTTARERPLDVPHLAGVYDSSPYLHDARSATLEEVFSRWNSQGLHGKAHQLNSDEMVWLLRYVREL